MDSRVLEHPHAQFGGSLGGLVGFPYPLGSHHHHHHHQHVYELAGGHQLQSAAAVPFSIDGLLNGSCSASVVSSNPLLSPDSQQFKLSGRPGSLLSRARADTMHCSSSKCGKCKQLVYGQIKRLNDRRRTSFKRRESVCRVEKF